MKFENTSAKPSFIHGDSCPVDANQRFLFPRYIAHKHLKGKILWYVDLFVINLTTFLYTYRRPSRGVDPGDIRGNSAGFANFWRPFLARDEGSGPLLHFRGKIHGQRPAGFVTSPPS